MKNFKYISILTACFILLFGSCTDDTETFNVSATPPVVLSDLTISSIELDPINTNNPAVTFNWSDANYGQQTVVSYKLEMASDNSFSNTTTVATVSGNNTVTLSVSELNSAAGTLGLPAFAWNTIYARVSSSLGTQGGLPVASNSVNFEVYPFFNYPFNDYYIVGDATAPGWNNNSNNPPLFRDGSDSNLYYYTGKFAQGGHFKVLETKGLWHPQYGTDDGSTIWNTTATATSPEPERFPYGGGDGIPEGYYTFTINFSTDTFTFEPFDISGAPTFTSITFEGTAVSSTSMNQLAFDNHIWYVNNVTLAPGELQFTTNTGSSWGAETEFSGQATENGGPIPVVVEDEYDVWFNDLTGRYIMIPLNL